ncbi:DUF3857 and transglutaminase domain-containing protein [Flavobacterium silvaticum]|uniref:DUF3857 domain-containing protein n=1 Tax=Flavobacterium silvaticum TaxID=1852020 RepID=A0A972FRN8_9FLAO|nr:DUF3857 domain-containing protein [Flavobacterium silvaticum]NMH27248.1 DUF3857 domain-containing protein [Flavobacterium silvaticum]
MKHLLTLALSVVSIFCTAQKSSLGKVTVAELEQKAHPVDASAAAAVISQIGNVSFNYSDANGFMMVTKVQTKIKIYNKEGYDQANISIQYYSDGSSRENIDISDAVTYNLVDGKIVKTKLKSDGEFDEKVNRYWSRKKITMPAVKEGSIIEYEYEVVSQFLNMVPDWDFQKDIPVNYSEFTFSAPEYYVYNANMRGYLAPKYTKTATQKSFMINSKERSGTRAVHTTFSNDKVDYLENSSKYVIENVPAMRDEEFVNNIHNYMSSVTHELSSIQYPNSTFQNFSTDWQTVTKKIYENDDFGPELDKTGYYDQEIAPLIAKLSTPEEKVAAIFEFVKTNVKWNGYHGYSCNDGVRQAYKNKAGNVAEINLMLTSMLRFAGITANPVLVSTRSNGIALFPSRTAFNYVIAAVELGNSTLLLDATEKYATPNILPLRDLNWNGVLMRKNGTSTTIPLMPSKASRETIALICSIKPDGHAEGQVRKTVTDNMALSFRERYVKMNQDQYLEQFENSHGKIEVSEYVRDNESDSYKPLIETFRFTQNDAMDIVGDKIYVSPMLFLKTDENPFKMEKREYPVDFGYPTNSRYSISIDIPEGYVVESMPESKSLVMENNMGSHKYIIQANGNKIQLSVNTEINEPIVPNTGYETLRNFFIQVVQKENEKIVLKKA